MSEHDHVAISDLDSAFARLTDDIDARTHAPGAERAVRSSQRRRTAWVAGLVVAATVTAGLLGSTLDRSGRPPAPVVASPSPQPAESSASYYGPTPTPRPLDTGVLADATRGWVTGWKKGDSPISTDLPCVVYDGPLPEAVEASTTEYRIGSRMGASHVVQRYATTEIARDAWEKQVWGESCAGEVTEYPGDVWTKGDSAAWEVRTDRVTYYELMALDDKAMTIFHVVGVGGMPDSVRAELEQALIADLRS